MLSVTTISFALARIVAGGGTTEVTTRATLVVEEKIMLMLSLVLLHFLHLYYSHNMNTRKEK